MRRTVAVIRRPSRFRKGRPRRCAPVVQRTSRERVRRRPPTPPGSANKFTGKMRAPVSVGVGDPAHGLSGEELHALGTVELNGSRSKLGGRPEGVTGDVWGGGCFRSRLV